MYKRQGISSRSPASSQSRQMYFRGVFFSTSRSSMTARMTMLPWKLEMCIRDRYGRDSETVK